MLRRLALLLPCLMLGGACAWSQAVNTASRDADIQVGAGYSSADANYEYVSNRIAGLYAYADCDFHSRFGVEASFHQLDDPNSAVYQRTYELGLRYVHDFTALGRDFHPYGKVQGGRGVLNFPKYANLAYNLVSFAGGVDVTLTRRFNVRVEYEYQDWFSAPGPGLNMKPSMVSVGLAYHFPAGLARRLGR